MDGKRTAPSGGVTARSQKSGRGAWIAAAALVGVLTGGVLGLGLYANGYDRVFPGVEAEGIDLSGLSRSELERALETERLLAGTITVTADGETLGTFSQTQLGASVDEEALVEAAWAVGREEGFWGWLKNGWRMLTGTLGGGEELEAVISGYDETALRRTAEHLAEVFDREPLDGSYELSREGLYATKSANGRALNQRGLMEAISTAEDGALEAPWEELPARPLDLDAMSGELSGSATPARYDVELGKVVDGTPGVSLDVEAAEFVLAAAAPGERVLLPAESVYPELTAQELEAVLFRDVLGSASTNVSGTSVRRGNVRLSGELVNGTVLNDGDVFDYNQVVGERTTKRGFGAAASYVNGQTVDTVGGGICQTSSTIYLAAMLSNLEIVERYNHRYWPGYIPLGMDATVSWGGPEFRFKNDSGFPIRIDVQYANSQLTVTILGTKLDETYVKMTNETLSTTSYETEYKESSDLAPGQQRQKQNGYTGYEVVTYRNIYDKDGNLLSRTQEAKSSYKNRNRIIEVGVSGVDIPETGGGPGEEGGGAPENDSGLPVTPPAQDDGEPELPPE